MQFGRNFFYAFFILYIIMFLFLFLFFQFFHCHRLSFCIYCTLSAARICFGQFAQSADVPEKIKLNRFFLFPMSIKRFQGSNSTLDWNDTFWIAISQYDYRLQSNAIPLDKMEITIILTESRVHWKRTFRFGLIFYLHNLMINIHKVTTIPFANFFGFLPFPLFSFVIICRHLIHHT